MKRSLFAELRRRNVLRAGASSMGLGAGHCAVGSDRRCAPPTLEHHSQPSCSGISEVIPLKQLASCVRPSVISRALRFVLFLLLALGATLAPLPLAAQTVSPPTIVKAFGAASIPLNGSTSLTFTITNPNAAASLSGIAFTDTLPAGLVVSTPSGLSGNCTPGSSQGTITATSGAGAVSISGGTFAASGSCFFTVANVTGTTLGTKNNSVQITSTEGGTGNTSNASVTVVAPSPPSIAKSFGAASIPLNGSTSLTFTITNPNAGAPLTGVAFTDTLPAGLVVSTPSGLSGNCTPGSSQGTITATSGAGAVSISGGTFAASGSCFFKVTNVTGTTAGTKNNSVQITSTEGGIGNTATATLDVTPATPVTLQGFDVY
jgi:uncharacterized repeat protein (TIGR01451 family)